MVKPSKSDAAKTLAQTIRDSAGDVLAAAFKDALSDFQSGTLRKVPEEIVEATERVFESKTQAYREALIGCALIRTIDANVDIHLPQVAQGNNSVSGRTVAEKIVTPFMKSQAIPVSSSPYLSSLRGAVRFEPGGEPRPQADQEGFDKLVEIVAYLRKPDQATAAEYLRYLLKRFIELRESVNIPLTEIPRLSLDQYASVIRFLLGVPSGGRIPSLITVAMLKSLSESHELGWEVEWQGINVADKASGAVGDITVKSGENIVLGIEVTERPLDEARVSNTFDEKIAPNKLEDYVFVYTETLPKDNAKAAARKFFSIGHEVNFLSVFSWTMHTLATIGAKGRSVFQKRMIELLSAVNMPKDLKVAWNQAVKDAIGS